MEMKLEYEMDKDPRLSWSTSHTPAAANSSLPFLLSGCGHFAARSRYFTRRTGLSSHLFIHTRSGAGRMVFRGRDLLVQAGQAVLIDCREPQYYATAELDPDGFWHFDYFHFSGSAAEVYDRAINGGGCSLVQMEDPTKSGDPGKPEIPDLSEEAPFASLAEEVKQQGVLADFRTSALITRILTRMLERRSPPCGEAEKGRNSCDMERISLFIKTHYREDLTVDRLASLVPMSRFHFIRQFKAYASVTPYEFLLLHRINASKALLKGTSLSVNETAYQVGFRDPSNFIRCFRKMTGTTPEHYRRYWIG